jgi:hypothetical protein
MWLLLKNREISVGSKDYIWVQNRSPSSLTLRPILDRREEGRGVALLNWFYLNRNDAVEIEQEATEIGRSLIVGVFSEPTD